MGIVRRDSKTVKDGLRVWGYLHEAVLGLKKTPKISQTSPPRKREDHEKYPAEVSATINTS